MSVIRYLSWMVANEERKIHFKKRFQKIKFFQPFLSKKMKRPFIVISWILSGKAMLDPDWCNNWTANSSHSITSTLLCSFCTRKVLSQINWDVQFLIGCPRDLTYQSVTMQVLKKKSSTIIHPSIRLNFNLLNLLLLSRNQSVSDHFSLFWFSVGMENGVHVSGLLVYPYSLDILLT